MNQIMVIDIETTGDRDQNIIQLAYNIYTYIDELKLISTHSHLLNENISKTDLYKEYY